MRSQKLISYLVLLLCAALVLYPLVFLLMVALNTGDPQAWPPESYGLANFGGLLRNTAIIWNTLQVSVTATLLSVGFGFTLAWVISRTQVPGRRWLEQLMALPYYVTPLVGALAWAALGGPKGGFINQIWFGVTGASRPLLNIYSPFGIAWVMALFEGSVAFVMISAAMKSMDPALEESSQVLGASKLRTMLRVTLPLLTPAVLSAAIFVFVEMLGSFSAAAILGMPERFYVITTAIWTYMLRFPPEQPLAAAIGLSLFGITAVLMYIYLKWVTSGTYTTVSGKGWRPRRMQMGWLSWPLFALCALYIFLAAGLPIGTLVYVSFLKFATAIPKDIHWTLENYRTALNMGPVRSAVGNSLLLGLGTATIGVLFMSLISWIVYRSKVAGRQLIEYVVMIPAAVPRMVFALGLLLAWLVIPLHIYGSLWLLLIAYLTVFLPLGTRTISGVMVQLDKSLEECARVCGASWGYQLRTVTLPLLKPGLIATWTLLFIASVREVGTSVLLMGPNTKVLGPSIISSWESAGMQLTASMALIQVGIVFVALLVLLRVGKLSQGTGE